MRLIDLFQEGKFADANEIIRYFPAQAESTNKRTNTALDYHAFSQ